MLCYKNSCEATESSSFSGLYCVKVPTMSVALQENGVSLSPDWGSRFLSTSRAPFIFTICHNSVLFIPHRGIAPSSLPSQGSSWRRQNCHGELSWRDRPSGDDIFYRISRCRHPSPITLVEKVFPAFFSHCCIGEAFAFVWIGLGVYSRCITAL